KSSRRGLLGLVPVRSKPDHQGRADPHGGQCPPSWKCFGHFPSSSVAGPPGPPSTPYRPSLPESPPTGRVAHWVIIDPCGAISTHFEGIPEGCGNPSGTGPALELGSGRGPCRAALRGASRARPRPVLAPFCP